MAMLGYCQIAALATIAEMIQVKARTATYFLFVIAALDRLSTAGWPPTEQNYARRVEIDSYKAKAHS